MDESHVRAIVRQEIRKLFGQAADAEIDALPESTEVFRRTVLNAVAVSLDATKKSRSSWRETQKLSPAWGGRESSVN